jgi:hypothetical protein
MDHGETVKDNLKSEQVDNLTAPARETPDPSLLKHRFETAITVIADCHLDEADVFVLGLRLPFTTEDYRGPQPGPARA